MKFGFVKLVSDYFLICSSFNIPNPRYRDEKWESYICIEMWKLILNIYLEMI